MCKQLAQGCYNQWNSGATRDSNRGRRVFIPSALTTTRPSHRFSRSFVAGVTGMSCSDLTTERLDEILACCSPRRETPRRQHAAGDHQTALEFASDALSTSGAYFLPVTDAARSPRRLTTARPRRTTILDDIDETLGDIDETTYAVCQPQRPPITAAWPSDNDDDDDDDDNDVSEKLEVSY